MPQVTNTDKLHAKWVPPPASVLKVNTNGAFYPATGKAAVGIIIRDHMGNPVLTARRVLFCVTMLRKLKRLPALKERGWQGDS